MTLTDARLYLCTDARTSPEDLRAFVRACYAGGVDIIQLRDKKIEGSDQLAALAVVSEEARRSGRLVAANDRADIAFLAEADVLHVGQGDLAPTAARRIVPNAIIGRSTHNEAQMKDAAADPDVDYFCTGPVWPTPTKPGRPAVGLDLVRAAATHVGSSGKPWFAIGGIDFDTIDSVVEAGATRVVVVRALTGTDDVAGAARRLRARLP
ncbi:thiamine phosphate synthase [Austwickia chelonae]|uniref:thiamine phosphate synthase n=1 Tax=Austwickia chelonae TaxID=100225 RepID=UPI000E282BCC|nr:thiamine phosphate synthase [Austwickia chelonae]